MGRGSNTAMGKTMQAITQVSTIWRQPFAALPYQTGVSLHSHTSVSEESLTFIHQLGLRLPGLAHMLHHYQTICRERYGIDLDFLRANWRPPLQPRMAYDLERRQIQRLGLAALVSITDHDSIDAPLLLRSVPSIRHIPVSTEWSVPYGTTSFHLGVHNLRSADGTRWVQRFAALTESGDETQLTSLLRELSDDPQVLVVLNHPLWDLYNVGAAAHQHELRRFLQHNGSFIHALELNGLRHARENRAVQRLARETGQLLVSGGDRHGLEPSANINLTGTTSFHDFVRELRVERKSHVLYLQQYARRWEQRIVASTQDAIAEYPHFMEGWRRWDDRVYHPDQHGAMCQVSQLWAGTRVPRLVAAAICCARLARFQVLSSPLSLAFLHVNSREPEMETS